jgi:RNA polymerase sigma factor (sigma-70 family)
MEDAARDKPRCARCDHALFLSDDELKALLNGEGSERSPKILLRRCAGLTRKFAVHHGVWQRCREDFADAVQVAALVAMSAIGKYLRARQARGDDCRFDVYLGREVWARLLDLLRRQRRRERHFERRACIDLALEHRAEQDHHAARDNLLNAHVQDDPSHIAQLHEMEAGLHDFGEGLEEGQGLVWQEWMAGASVRATAKKIGVSRAWVKRVRGLLLRKFRRNMHDLSP